MIRALGQLRAWENRQKWRARVGPGRPAPTPNKAVGKPEPPRPDRPRPDRR